MKRLSAVFVVMISLTPLFAQDVIQSKKSARVTFKANAGTTLTIVPDFNNRVIIGLQEFIANYTSTDNMVQLFLAEGHSTVRPLLGWFVEAELGYRLPRNYAITFSAGLKKMRFDYQTTFSLSGIPEFPEPVNLDEVHGEFGYTSLLYVSVTPLIFQKGL